LYAVNDVFIGRRSIARLVNVECRIDGETMATYRADGLLVATPSGSTGYALAAGGPVLHPQSQDMILMPVCSHVTFDKALVLPQKTVLGLTIITRHEAMISVDGQVEVQLKSGDYVEVMDSPYTAKLMRIQSGNYFYRSLESKLRRKTT
jgi:NAD+ kinase